MHKSKGNSMKSPGKHSAKKPSYRKSLTTKKDILSRRSQPMISTSEPLEDYQPSAGLFEDKQDVEGGNMFKVTPLKTKKIEKDVLSLSAKKTPKSPKVATPKVEDVTQGFPLRQRMKQELASMKDLQLDSDPEDSDENNSGCDDVESEDDTQEMETETPRKRRDRNAKTFPETYFIAQKQKKTATSNRTLSNLKLGQSNIEELFSVLKNAPEYHKKEKELMFRHYKSQFEKWNLLLHQGFNILLYGIGSKQKLLNAFCKEHLADALHVVVHGFFPSLNLKQILCSITEEGLEHEGKFSSIQEHAEFIKKHFSEGDEELYLVVHNIDGMVLRNVKTQALLSSLAAVPNIHFVCSIDHINSPLIWDQIMLSHFKWVWFDVTNFEPYILETSYENSIFKEQSSHLLLSSLLHVYRSLTPNGQGVFMILAKQQFEEKKQGFTGIAFHEWYQECREAFLVNSEITMQAQLSEFKNHKLLTSRKSVEGTEVWYIPVDSVTLEQFLESCK